MLMGKTALLVTLTFFSNSPSVSAIEDFKISKTEILQSLNMLKEAGKISEADYAQAKKELLAMNDKQVNDIQDKAMDVINKNPGKAQEMVTAKKIELPKE